MTITATPAAQAGRDVRFQNEGSLILIYGETPTGRDWLGENLPADCPRFGAAYCVEARFMEDILCGMACDGLRFVW